MEITISQFKAKCLGVVDKVQKEGFRVRISKYGKVAAELVPVVGEERCSIWGRSKDATQVLGDPTDTGESWDADT